LRKTEEKEEGDMITEEIRERLFALQDLSYRDFQKSLIPGISEDAMIGVRTPDLKKLAKEYAGREETEEFLRDTPHRYFDENQLHAFIISGEKDFETCIRRVEEFLPLVDNWATCDQLSPRVFKKHRKDLLPHALNWMEGGHTYTVRFGIGMLMQHFLEEDFDTALAERVAYLRSEEYYVNMMRAWYFATALAKQYEAILPFMEKRALDPWTHNRAIQKACESFRVSEERKEYLKTLKIPGEKKRGGKKRAEKGG
jgi:3-methyladenine DNA glycosylase AlkD